MKVKARRRDAILHPAADGGWNAPLSSGSATRSPEPALRILLVEDDETLALVITYNLQAHGYSVTWIGRGDVVNIYLSTGQFDLILLDWMLPGRSGLDICRSLRAGSDTRHIPIIIVTARADEDDRATGIKAGADDYIAKPFTMASLIARVRTLINKEWPPNSIA